jgi:hypothetical protein
VIEYRTVNMTADDGSEIPVRIPVLTPEELTEEYREEMEGYFNLVKDPGNWKNPIATFFHRSDATPDKIAKAIEYYTGSEAEFEDVGEGWWKVTSPGYYPATEKEVTRENTGRPN